MCMAVGRSDFGKPYGSRELNAFPWVTSKHLT
jgi:hypothetical protein